MNCCVEDLITITKNEVGYIERASNNNLDSKTANAGNNNYTKYARDLDAIPGFYNGKNRGSTGAIFLLIGVLLKHLGLIRLKDYYVSRPTHQGLAVNIL